MDDDVWMEEAVERVDVAAIARRQPVAQECLGQVYAARSCPTSAESSRPPPDG
jgi:hypothetical protein